MAEVKETAAKKAAKESPKMVSVDEANAQMQKIVDQANGKIQQLVAQLDTFESLLRDKTMEQLFKVLEYGHLFNSEFVDDCTNMIKKYLTKTALEEPKEEEEVPAAEEVKEEE